MIKPKLKTCAACGEEKIIWKNFEGNKYCKNCWYRKEPPKYPTKSTIKPVSDKRKPLDELYSVLRRRFLSEPGRQCCAAKLPGCQGCGSENLTIHHKRGRGKYYLDPTTWVQLCFNCHRWVEEHPDEAKELNLSESRV